jgi:hypothetical protein
MCTLITLNSILLHLETKGAAANTKGGHFKTFVLETLCSQLSIISLIFIRILKSPTIFEQAGTHKDNFI